MRHSVKFKFAYLPSALLTVTATTLAIWLFYQHVCCGLPVLWFNICIVVAGLGAGWLGGVYHYQKYGRMPWQR